MYLAFAFDRYTPNKSDRHDIAEILLKVALNTITLTIASKDLIAPTTK
jgi:hypothetical protein